MSMILSQQMLNDKILLVVTSEKKVISIVNSN